MLGKIAGALIGRHVAGKNKGLQGALIGVAVETVARRLIPTLAAAAVLGFGFKKAKDYLTDDEPAHPSDAEPSLPSGEPAGPLT